MSLISTPRQIGKTFKNAARLKTIVGTFAKYGFQDVLEKIKLGSSFLRRFENQSLKDLSTAERMVLAFEELGPTFVKLGQLIATRPDLVPAEFSEEFKRLHDQVAPIKFSLVQTVLNQHYGIYSDVFEWVDEKPLASASIAQVHQAILKDGQKVVIKVQRPGIKKIISNDIQVLYFLADLLSNNFEDTKIFNPRGIVDELARTLSLETNFIVEANNIRKFQKNFANDAHIKIPEVYLVHTGETVLVMEQLEGIALSRMKDSDYLGLSRESIIRNGIRAYFEMVFQYGFFHGDLHSGNLFILPEEKIGLIDFGVVGRLNDRSQKAIAAMFVSLFNEDYDRLALEYIDLAPFNEQTNIEDFSRELRGLLSPYFGLTMKNVNLGKILMGSTSIAAKHKVSLPADLILFFKSIVTVEGMGRQIIEDFDLMPYAMEFAQELIKIQLDPKRMFSDVSGFARDGIKLAEAAPRQIHQLLKKLNNPELTFQFNFKEIKSVQKSIETSGHLVFMGLVIASLILSSSLIMVLGQNGNPGTPLISTIFLVLAGLLAMFAFGEYLRKK